jgi:hypothetical protein
MSHSKTECIGCRHIITLPVLNSKTRITYRTARDGWSLPPISRLMCCVVAIHYAPVYEASIGKHLGSVMLSHLRRMDSRHARIVEDKYQIEAWRFKRGS